MGLFGGKKEEKPKEAPASKKIIIGVNPELVNRVREKVSKLKDEKGALQKDYNELIQRMSMVEGKCDAIDATFKQFKNDLMNEFMEEARKNLKKEMKKLNDSISNNHSRIINTEEDLLKLTNDIKESEQMSLFQQYYQLIRFCIYMITNIDANNYPLIGLLLKTIHSLADDMRRNGFWESSSEAIITSMLNLKTYWRSRDERVESLIGAEVEALEQLR